MRYPRHRRNPAADLTLVEELDALAARVADLEAEGEFVDLAKVLRPILNRHFGRHLGPSADWINPTWPIGGDLYLFEGDYDDYAVVSRTPDEDPDEPDVIEEVEALRNLDALRRYFRKHPRRNPDDADDADDAVDWPDELKDLVDGYKNEFVADVTGPWADYGVVADQYVARIMRELGDAPYESETASDDFIDRWEKGLVEAEVLVMLGAALEGRGRGRAAHQASVPARRNPPRRPPPPPSHTFQLTADPYQQRLFGPEAFEQRPKKRAVEPMPVDERQVDLFAPPPPPAKKNPRANPTCPKCGGTGKLSAFRHVEQGTCFRCGGTGEVDKLTPAEKGQAAPPPPTGSYGVWVSSEDYNTILTAVDGAYLSFEAANRQRKDLAKEHKDATYTVVKFDGKEWRTRSGERADSRRRR